jgi:hypothetical protein
MQSSFSFYKCRCAGTTTKDRRCKQKVLLPMKMKWTCVDHTIDYETTKMEETKANVFHLAPKQGGEVVEIRHKFYIDGKVNYVIYTPDHSKSVDANQFYQVPSHLDFYIIQ